MLIIHVLPLAAGAALSPALLGASVEILLAFGSSGARMLLNYLLGAAVVVVGAGALALLLPTGAAGEGLITDVVDIVLGATLLALALVLAVRRSTTRPGGAGKRLLSSRWAATGVVGLGIVMMITNVSTLVLLLAGAHEVVSATAGPVASGLCIGLLALGALTPILLPLLWVAVRPTAAASELQRMSAFISKRGRVLGVAVCVLTGGYLLARGSGAI